MKKIKEIHKYYIGCYFAGYVISLLITGVPSLIYLLPIKLFGFFFSFVCGKSSYLIVKYKLTRYESLSVINYKRALLAVPLVLLTMLIGDLFLEIGIDISFLTVPIWISK